ncbi:MAG: hypothetical protein KH828_02755 [Clostridiales bacterium]|nr:hypothetical protein [Clostridiales bacterium]
MKKINFEEDELVVMALYAAKTKQETIEVLTETLDMLEASAEDITDEEMIGIVASLIEKLQQIEDKYFYSLDLEAYLYDMEEDGNEE